jgi:hypothetical protein
MFPRLALEWGSVMRPGHQIRALIPKADRG